VGQKVRGGRADVPLLEGAGFSYNTKSPGPRPTSVPSGIFTDRHADTHTDNGSIASGKPFYKWSPKNHPLASFSAKHLPLLNTHPGEPVPEENFWTLWCKGRLTETDTPTIRLGTTPSGLSSAHLHHPPFFTGRMPFLPPSQQCQSTEGN